MGILMDAYNQVLMKNNPAIPQINALPSTSSISPEDIASYREQIRTPYSVAKVPSIADIPQSIGEAYTKAGGGVGGVAMGALTGLGKIGEVMNTSTGEKIMAGLAHDPYLAQGFLGQAGEAKQNEIAQRQMAFEGNKEKMKEQGENIRAQQAQESEATRAKAQQMAEMEKARMEILARKPELDLKQKEYELLKSKEGRESEEVSKKPLIDSATDMYKKGKLSEEDYNKFVTNPHAYQIIGSGWGLRTIQLKPQILEDIRKELLNRQKNRG